MRFTENEKFSEIYTRYKEKVYITALQYINIDYNLAEEITQAVFLELYVNIDDIHESTVENWLTVVAKNKALNELTKRGKEYSNDHLLFKNENNKDKVCRVEEFYENNAEEVLIQRDDQKRLIQLSDRICEHLKKKNERWYRAVCLVYGLEKSSEEAARIMGLSVSAFYSLVYRARNWIRENYEEEYHRLKNL